MSDTFPKSFVEGMESHARFDIEIFETPRSTNRMSGVNLAIVVSITRVIPCLTPFILMRAKPLKTRMKKGIRTPSILKTGMK